MRGGSLYLRVGMLVVAGVLLAVGFVIFLAGQRGGGPTTVFETYSSESVQGLDVGAPVRFRGVPIGRVTEIKLASAEYRRPAAAPFGNAFQLVLIRFSVEQAQMGQVTSLEEAVRSGLRARISAQGITGVNYVELDFVNPERFPPLDVPWTPRYPMLPSIPSTVAQVRSAAEQLVTRLSDVPLEQMVSDLASLIASLNAQANEGDLATALREAATVLSQIRGVLLRSDVDETFASVRGAADAARDLAAAPEIRRTLTSAAAAAEELRRATQRLPGALQSFDRTMRTARETTVDVQAERIPTLSDLRAAVANLRAVTEQLRSSPSQFLLGAPPAPERRR